MELKVERITPNMALEYLKKNVNNYRKLSRQKVLMYSDEMKAGRWQLNGEPIVFDEEGFLKDGQHRLAAIAKSGVPIEIAVIRGVDKDVNVYDIGAVRSAQQIAKASGYDVNASIVGAVNMFINPYTNISKSECVEYIEKHHEELRRAYKVVPGADKRYSRKSACILAAYLMLRTNAVPTYEMEVFFRVFESMNVVGCDGYDPSSALVARRMFEDRTKSGGSNRVVMREQLEIIILALTDFHNKKSRQLNYKISEPFKYEQYLDKVRKEDGIE